MPTYKTRRVLRDLESKCEVIPNNNGSHQKFRNPITGQTSIVPAHLGKDMPQYFVKNIYRQLGLELDY
ncbi:MAG: type II toxin-antitoxin system HicA family toxin [Selenomonadaceae bacterium]|nr:type II toxin-antitoxin system HicA family toxin [Selenomonadaceae bacterium]